MRKQIAISLALVTVIAASGCGKTEDNVSKGSDSQGTVSSTNSTSSTASTPTTTPSTLQATVGTMTTANIGEKLTAAGYTYTTKDETSDLATIPSSKDAAGTATKYKIKGTAGNIDTTIIVITNPAKIDAIKKDIEAQWAIVKKISATSNMEFVDVGAANLLVTFSYKTDDKELAMKIKEVIAKK